MAGAVADGVFIRLGTDSGNISAAIRHIYDGAAQAGRKPNDLRLGIVFHTVLVDESEAALTMAKSIAAGYYDQTPSLFGPAELSWDGPPTAELKRQHAVWPDFHHATDLIASGRAVSFLSREAADRFSLWGGPVQIAGQLLTVLETSQVHFDYVILQPIPDPMWPADIEADYTQRMATEVLPQVRMVLQRANS
jgi:alkanesulfonate monooxygenase SsuD/methylene tetrahydromethanopterin reductase-like flavin-dependent oxidoreductase (luciferase family)